VVWEEVAVEEEVADVEEAEEDLDILSGVECRVDGMAAIVKEGMDADNTVNSTVGMVLKGTVTHISHIRELVV